MLHRVILPIVAALTIALPAVGQEREVELQPPPLAPNSNSTTPGTYRDPEAAAIGAAREELKTWATTKVERLSHWNRAGTTKSLRAQQYGQQTRLVEFADDAMSRRYIQNLGRATWVADSGATIAGYVVEGNYEGAVVAAADEGAKSVSAWGGATALGELGGAVGGAFGGPPGLMIGGAVGAVSGAVLATLGYNAFISPTLSGAVNEALEPDYKELARQNREEHLQELGAAIAVILIEQDKLRKETETAATPEPAQAPVATGQPDARPVIPAACKIVAVFKQPKAPEIPVEWTFQIRDGKVTAHMIPISVGGGVAKMTCDFTGTIVENQISGEVTAQIGPFERQGDSGGPPWRQRITYTWSARKATAVLSVDKTISFDHAAGEVRMRVQVLEGELINGRKDWSRTDKQEADTFQGAWRFAD